MSKVKCIETEYNGLKFRSRAQARWAYFFDLVGIKYQYQPQGLQFSDGLRYLPDFYLPDMKTWLQVKGVMDDYDEKKIKRLVRQTNDNVVVGYADLSFSVKPQFEGKDFFDQYRDAWAKEGVEIKDCDFYMNSKCTSWLCRCNKCKQLYFIDGNGCWGCTRCGYYDGDATMWCIYGDWKEWYAHSKPIGMEDVYDAFVLSINKRF